MDLIVSTWVWFPQGMLHLIHLKMQELEIINFLKKGASSKQIVFQLIISVKPVGTTIL
jgi:hypothetical protein